MEVLAAAGKLDDALAQAKTLIDADTDDTDLLKLGIEIALVASDLTTAESWEKLLKVATDNGPDARYMQARRQLMGFDKLDSSARLELERLIGSVRAARPQWFPILALAGELARLQGDNRAALTDFQLAVNRGDRRPATLQQLASLLFEADRFDEAQQYLAQLSAEQVTSPFLDSMAIEIAVRQDRPAMALELAQQSLERFPDDPVRHLYLASLLVRNGKQSEALDVLRQASQKFSDDPRVWTGLVTTLVQAGQTDEARKVLEQLVSHPELAKNRGHFVAAQGYEQLGDGQAARQQYELAIAATTAGDRCATQLCPPAVPNGRPRGAGAIRTHPATGTNQPRRATWSGRAAGRHGP